MDHTDSPSEILADSEKSPEALARELRVQGCRRVKLGITDIDGVLRGKYVSIDKFESMAESGSGFCDCIFGWDVEDQLYDNGSFSGWHKGFPDASYRLDLDTIRVLPYEDGTPFFLAELIPPAGDDFHPVCPRNQLKRVLAQLGEAGFAATLGFEYEFFLFDENPHSVREKGYRDLSPYTPGNFGYSVLRASVSSDLHEDFMDFCETMDMPLEGYHTETGAGVLEAAILHADGLDAADRAVLFKTFSKVYFQRQGLIPTFMAKWSPDFPGQSGHLHISLRDIDSGAPLFHDAQAQGRMSETMQHFVAGQVAYMREMCALVAPTINSYTRLVKGAWAPTAAAWGIDNRTTALRVIPGSAQSTRVEYRLGAADGNPYLVAAAALASGLAGIQEKLTLPEAVAGNAYEIQDGLPKERQLPGTLREAAGLLAESQVARRIFGDAFVEHFVATRLWEAREFERQITDWELARYFEII
ncbi:glutamine synthetase family protein [Haliangium ochraceum]|uniref:Glutamate--putrescine ligase n=1 Tax=Haliangium ochraceum (strain DSM 14365 / JCM 11303 / SMP-2) TaxID=502025 RepID=D0LJE9_HALO1|nr:glutamine synthetase family protein [Haliangium ochraceum]ACY16523.1 Glutamate--putrescine ligase [Haliangium ochraceum DSM 14365]